MKMHILYYSFEDAWSEQNNSNPKAMQAGSW